jgi:hypothetical protein
VWREGSSAGRIDVGALMKKYEVYYICAESYDEIDVGGSCIRACTKEGFPFPSQIMWNQPDRCMLIIQDLIRKDEGLYSCSATNVAGSVSTSCMLHVVDDDNTYHWRNYSYPHKVPIRPKSIYDLYDIGDELGRGTQGVTYHAVERSTGKPE